MKSIKTNEFIRLLAQDSIAYINKYITQILLLIINPEVYIVYAVGEAIYLIIYGGIYGISESAKRDTLKKKTIEEKEDHLSNTILTNLLFGLTLCLITICFRQHIGNVFFNDSDSIKLLNVYFILMVFKCFSKGLLRPLYSVGNAEGKIIKIAKINKNRLTYMNILLLILYIVNKNINLNNATILIIITSIYVLTELHQAYLTYKIVGKLNIKSIKFNKSITILKENYHYLLSLIVYDFGSLISTYIGSLYGAVGILISKILYESYNLGSFIHNIYTKYLEEQMYIGKIKKYKIVITKTTVSAIIGSIVSIIIFVLQLKFNPELQGIISLNVYSYIFIFVFCLGYCLDYSSDIVTRISGNVKQLFTISIIDLVIKLLIVLLVQYVTINLFLSFSLLVIGGFISYLNVIRISNKDGVVNIYDKVVTS